MRSADRVIAGGVSDSAEVFEIAGWRVGSQRSDSVAPQLLSVSPALGVQTLAPGWLQLEFSEPLLGIGLGGEQGLRLRAADGRAVAATLRWLHGASYELRFDGTLPDGRYTLSAGTAVTDLAGNALVLGTLPALELDTTAPFVASSQPRQGDTDAPLEGELRITFSEPVSFVGATPKIVIGQPFGGGYVSLDASFDGTTLRATLPTPLQRDREYQLSWEGNIVDAAGIFRGPLLLNFRTTSGPLQRAEAWAPGYNVNGVLKGDVDGDGREDLVFAAQTANGLEGVVGLRLTLPGGGLGPVQLILRRDIISGGCGLQLGDFDGDGRNDVLIGGCEFALVGTLLLRQTAAGVFESEANVPSIGGVSQGPFQRTTDARRLLVVDTGVSGELSLMVRHGPGDWRELQRIVADGHVLDTVRADVNGDGLPDLGLLSWRIDPSGMVTAPPKIGWALGSATGLGALVATPLVIPDNGEVSYFVRRLHAADTDGDGRVDLIVGTEAYHLQGESLRDRLAWLRNDGAGGFEAPRFVESSEGRSGFASGDLNGDGRDDLIVSVDDSSLAVMLGSASDGLQAERIFQTGLVGSVRPNFSAVIDVDGDGRPDLIYGGQLLRGAGSGPVWPLRTLVRRVTGR